MNEAEAVQQRRLRAIQLARLTLGFLICLPLLVATFAWHAVNVGYFSNAYEPLTYWLTNAPVYLGGVLAGAMIAFWKFRSARAGVHALLCGVAVLLAVGSLAWTSVS